MNCRDILDTVKDVYGSKMKNGLKLPLQQKMVLACAIGAAGKEAKQFSMSQVGEFNFIVICIC